MSGEHTPEPSEAAIRAAAKAIYELACQRVANDPTAPFRGPFDPFESLLKAQAFYIEEARVALLAAAPETAAERDRLLSDVEHLRDRNGGLRIERDAALRQNSADIAEIRTLRANKTASDELMSQASAQIDELRAERDRLRAELNLARTFIESAEKECSELRAEKAELVALVAKIASFPLWRDTYDDSLHNRICTKRLDDIFTCDDVYAARTALAKAKATATEGGDA